MVIDTASKVLMLPSERTKLNGVATDANNYNHPANHPASIITQDSLNRFMTDAEKTKLGGIALSANNYNHPSTHPYSIISNPPVIPTLTSQLTNNSGFLTSSNAVTGTYTGNSTLNRIISVGPTPKFVFIHGGKYSANSSSLFSQTSIVEGVTIVGFGAGTTIIGTVNISANKFTVGGTSGNDFNMNVTGQVYNWLAIS